MKYRRIFAELFEKKILSRPGSVVPHADNVSDKSNAEQSLVVFECMADLFWVLLIVINPTPNRLSSKLTFRWLHKFYGVDCSHRCRSTLKFE